MTENRDLLQYQEGSPWFWKIFGGAIMGIISILLLTHITNINSNIDRTFLSLRGENKDLYVMIDSQKERLVGLEQNREQYKEKISSLEKSLLQSQLSIDEFKQKVVATETQLNSLKEEIKALKDLNKDTIQQLQEVREKLVAADAAKKATIESTNKK
jgi:chromosome segregation ATPase